MDEYGAAFGFFPQLKPRRNINTDTSSLPLDVFRGRLAGLLGAPSDILNLLSSPKPMEVFGDVDYSPNPQLPYGSEQWLKELPLPPTSQAGNVLGKAASFVPLNPAPVIRGVQKAGQIAGEELAATMLGQRPNSLLDKVVPKPMFAVPPEQGLLTPAPVEPATSLLQTKPQAPVSDIGFYSAAEQAAMNIKRNAGPGQAMLNDILKGENVKADEIKWIGLDEYLKNKPNVTKQEVQDFIANNKVDVKEVTLDNSKTIAREKLRDESVQALQKLDELIPDLTPLIRANLTSFWAPSAQAGNASDLATIQKLNLSDAQMQSVMDYGAAVNRQRDFIESSNGYMAQPKFGQYTLPGGENYREILLTMPDSSSQARENLRQFQNEMKQKYGRLDWRRAAGAEDQLKLDQLLAETNKETYRSSHWDEPNILAHMRVNDRVDADGKKMLLIEEVQSDWHQAGRDKGYGPKMEKTVEAYYETKSGQRIPIGFGKTKEEAEASIDVGWKNMVDIKYDTIERKIGEGVPDAPFKDTWYQLALKRAMKYAADNGYDRVGLTTGARQAERYDLSKQVDELLYKRNENGTYRLSAQAGGRGNMIGEAIPKEKLADYVGKDVAKSIVDGSGKDINLGGSGSYSQPKDMWKSMSGIDLQVGGEGMKKYYDEIYPKFLDKYGKKWGAKVGETTINLQKDLEGFMPRKNMQIESVRYIDITPEMRTSTSKGQPLFSAAPLLPTTGLLADEEKRKELKSLLEY
jgi:hypothetical protein